MRDKVEFVATVLLIVAIIVIAMVLLGKGIEAAVVWLIAHPPVLILAVLICLVLLATAGMGV